MARAQIWFRPETTQLYRGIKFGALVELESSSGGSFIDQSYVYASCSTGELRIGTHDSVGYRLLVVAPHVPISIDPDADYGTLIADMLPLNGQSGREVSTGDDFFRVTFSTTRIENDINVDPDSVSFTKHRKYGLILGDSYARRGPTQGAFSVANCNGSNAGTGSSAT